MTITEQLMAPATSTEVDTLWAAIEKDVTSRLPFTREFPITAMTRAVAQTIRRLPAASDERAGAARRALDVGTGTGAHALIMCACGYEVDAIDVNAQAIAYAKDRAERLRCLLNDASGGHREAIPIRFAVVGVDDYRQTVGYNMITCNPTAYYHPLGPIPDLPVAQGVYVDDENDRDPTGALLYRFFDKIVLPLLRPDGHVICSWPGLERRVVESVHGETRGRIMSPIEKLETWFEITVVGDRNPGEFFDRTARVNSDFNYGLHETFWNNLIAARDKYMYSGLANGRGAEDHLLEFKFGVLHLVRDSDDPTLFRHVPESPTDPMPSW